MADKRASPAPAMISLRAAALMVLPLTVPMGCCCRGKAPCYVVASPSPQGSARCCKCTIRASPPVQRSGRSAPVGRLVVLPELSAMLPDEPDRAKGRSAIAAKKVCKVMRHNAQVRCRWRRCGLVRALQGVLRAYQRLSACGAWCEDGP